MCGCLHDQVKYFDKKDYKNPAYQGVFQVKKNNLCIDEKYFKGVLSLLSLHWYGLNLPLPSAPVSSLFIHFDTYIINFNQLKYLPVKYIHPHKKL